MSKELGPFIPLYYGDFIGGTMSFGADEVGAYLLLICYQWQNGHIENDPHSIERIARCEYGHLQRVLKKFKPDGNGGLINERCEQIRQERKAFMENARESGIRGYEARWGKLPPSASSNPDSNPNRVPNRVPNSKPDTSSSSSSSSSSESPSREEKEGHTPPSRTRNLSVNPPTFEQCIELCAGIGMRQTDIQAFFDHYDSQGWLKSNGQPATNLRSLLSNWKNREQQYSAGKKGKGANYDHSIS
jgi:uncharacterized protein YdaU (DUF1376 family)